MQESRHPSPQPHDQSSSKRLQTSPSSCTAKEELRPTAGSEIDENSPDPLQYWIQTGRWCKEYFEQDSQVREDIERGKSPEKFEERDYLQEHLLKQPLRPIHGFHPFQHLFARKKSSASLRRKNSQSTLQTGSDQLPREVKSAQYRNSDYVLELEVEGSYMHDSDLNITDDSKSLCRRLLQMEQTVPQDSLFRDDLFAKTCRNLQNRNEAMVIRDIGLLIVPSVQTLATFGATHLNHLYETANEGWNSALPFLIHKTPPQPDYSVGFGRSAFTQEQLNKLKPFIGEPGSKVLTHFMTTTRMYFPFLTCEVKCGAAALDVADRQNAHSMTVAVRAFVELFKCVGREKELDRAILAFSISHDHRTVRIYGHYAVIEGDKSMFYCHPIRTFDFTEQDGMEKWATLRFVKNVYDHHSPSLHKKICSGIDDLPANINFDLSQSASFSQSTPQSSRQSNVGSILGEDDSQSSFLGSQEITPTTSFAQPTERASKKPRNQPAAGQ